ncbi:MAG: ZIP family metal transporter [Candidatus Woesearchaeota archaeon]
MVGISLWLWTIGSVIVVSLCSLIGIITLSVNLKTLRSILFFFVSFAAGAMIGDAIIHILPEVVEEYGFGLNISLYFISGVLAFFILEKFIHWRHCHVPEHEHTFAYMNLFGDALHNLIDGMIIAGSYIVSVPVGIATTIAVVFHEIPQEIGDFGVLIHGGFSRAKALFFNFLISLSAVIGAVASLIIVESIDKFSLFLLPFTAGGFIYIAGSDLIPELNKECEPSKNFFQLFGMVIGVSVMLALLLLE